MLSVEEVKARSTSPIGACKASLEVWEHRAGLPASDLLAAKLGPSRCGLCYFYGNLTDWCPACDLNGNGPCLLWSESNVGNKFDCCPEYDKAGKAYKDYKDGNATAAQVHSAFWAMAARLETELKKLEAEEKTKQAESEKQATKKVEIRHGDLGVTGLRNAGVVIGYEKPQFFMSSDVRHSDINKEITWLDINIFDVMAEAMKGKTEYNVAGIDFKREGGGIRIENYWFSHPDHVADLLRAVVSLAIQHKLAQAKKGKCDA